MSRVVYYTATTLDGYIADPEDSLDWLLRQDLDEDGSLNYSDFVAEVGALVMGSTTYRWVLEHEQGAWPYRLPTWVLTTRDLAPPAATGTVTDAAAGGAAGAGAGVRFARGPITPVLAAAREAAGAKDVWIVGGGDLAGQCADVALLDEVITYIAPVTLGAGRPVLPRRLDLELVEAARNRGFLTARYRVLGPLTEDRRPG